jgi:hypothetical protein
MAILGPATDENPDEKRLREKAMGSLRPEQVLDVELKMTFPMRQWNWAQQRRFTEGLDAVLYQHITGKSRNE